jgi:diguanylate cyclase (GGDEF)-like protein
MNNKNSLRILLIDDNTEIHKDFIKILMDSDQESASDNADILGAQIFGEEYHSKNTPSLNIPKFQIDSALQGIDGIKMVAKAKSINEKYALAFIDIRMPPGIDGIETIKNIWEIDRDIQVVICTAYSDYTWHDTVNYLGITDNLLILKKPFDYMAVRQLTCALTKKWLLMQESKDYNIVLENYVQERTENLIHQATHDNLTDLPNRTLLYDRLDYTIELSNRNKSIFAVLYFDLDDFKSINDNFGHESGDIVLKTIAQRVRSNMRKQDTLFRLGGDEFVMLIPNIGTEENIIHIVNNLLKITQETIPLKTKNINISCSIGISIYPQNGKKSIELLNNSDLAMYHSKELGGNQFKFYTNELNSKVSFRAETEIELQEAIDKNQFLLCYLPQVDLKNDKLIAVEALIRWNHPKLGVLLPAAFIPAAEKSELIISIGEWVIKTAIMQNKIWQNKGYKPILISVNVAIQQIRQANFVERLNHYLKASSLDPQYFGIELIENAFINSIEIINVINEIKNMGVKITLDNFGTGNMSLNYLKKVKIDYLKIDKSFIEHLGADHNNKVIVESIINIANSLNLKVIAEGIETSKHKIFLQQHDCQYAQGYYFSKPLVAKDLELLLEK